VATKELGVYIGDFDSSRLSRVFAFDSDDPRQHYHDPLVRPIIDWSPTGKKLLFSYRGKITAFDVDSGSSEKVADGGSAQWSPSGDQISFVGVRSQAMLLE
jgi:hypothetical protein